MRCILSSSILISDHKRKSSGANPSNPNVEHSLIAHLWSAQTASILASRLLTNLSKTCKCCIRNRELRMQALRMTSSCLSCAKRKVRCDRLKPCSHCKRRKGDVCEYPVSISTLIKNLQKTPSSASTVQSERIEILERYIRNLGHDPDKVAQNSLTNPTVSNVNEHSEPKDLPGSVALRPTASQPVDWQDISLLSTTKTNSRNSEQAQLVHHDEETTYIETFVYL